MATSDPARASSVATTAPIRFVPVTRLTRPASSMRVIQSRRLGGQHRIFECCVPIRAVAVESSQANSVRTYAAAALALFLLLEPAARAFELTLDTRALDDAIRIGLSRLESDRTTFHQPYRIEVGRAPVDWIDIITPFRRVVLEAETRTAG